MDKPRNLAKRYMEIDLYSDSLSRQGGQPKYLIVASLDIMTTNIDLLFKRCYF